MRAPAGQAMTEAAVVVMAVAVVWMALDRSEYGLTSMLHLVVSIWLFSLNSLVTCYEL